MFHPISFLCHHRNLGKSYDFWLYRAPRMAYLLSADLLQEALPKPLRTPSHQSGLSLASTILYSLLSSRILQIKINWNYYTIFLLFHARLFIHFSSIIKAVRSEELGVRSVGRGAQLIKRPNTPFYINAAPLSKIYDDSVREKGSEGSKGGPE